MEVASLEDENEEFLSLFLSLYFRPNGIRMKKLGDQATLIQACGVGSCQVSNSYGNSNKISLARMLRVKHI